MGKCLTLARHGRNGRFFFKIKDDDDDDDDTCLAIHSSLQTTV